VYASPLHRIGTTPTLKELHLKKFIIFVRQVTLACCFCKKPKEVKVWMLVKPDFALEAKLGFVT